MRVNLRGVEPNVTEHGLDVREKGFEPSASSLRNSPVTVTFSVVLFLYGKWFFPGWASVVPLVFHFQFVGLVAPWNPILLACPFPIALPLSRFLLCVGVVPLCCESKTGEIVPSLVESGGSRRSARYATWACCVNDGFGLR